MNTETLKRRHRSTSTNGRNWIYSVPEPRKYSPLWMLESIAMLGVPVAALSILGVASAIGIIKLY